MPDGGVYSIGYNAWKGKDGLSRMFDALESEGVTILVDTRTSDYGSRYSHADLAREAGKRTGQDGRPMRFAPRPVLSGKPQGEHEFTQAGQTDYRAMNARPEARQMLDGIAEAAGKGERIALLCACADTCTCHRTRWLARSLAGRGVDVGHIEPGVFDAERHREEGVMELYTVTRHRDLPELPPHSDLNWRELGQQRRQTREPQPPPPGYQSPKAERPLPEKPEQILIAGSMKANPAQLNYASALVLRAAETGAQIHVGDNAEGVDARVVETANAIGYNDVVVWTPEDKPRNGGVKGGEMRRVPHNPRAKGNRFTQRDHTMIGALDDETGAAFFIDNGFTHHPDGRISGTEAGYAYAIEQGKAARKVSFGRAQDRAAELKPLPTAYRRPPLPPIPNIPPDLALDLPSQPETPSEPKRYPTLAEFEAGILAARGATPPPQSEPETLNSRFHLVAMPTLGAEGQPMGYSALAVQTVSSPGQDEERYGLELGRFAEESDAQAYVKGMERYIREKTEMPLSGTPEQTAEARAFFGQVAYVNGLSREAQTLEKDTIGFQPAFGSEVAPFEAVPSIPFSADLSL